MEKLEAFNLPIVTPINNVATAVGWQRQHIGRSLWTNIPIRWAGYPFNTVFISNTLWKCDPQNSEPKATNRSSQMRPNQLLLGTFLNFLTLFDKRKNANKKNVAVFIILHNAMIQSFLMHFFTNLQFFLSIRGPNQLNMPKDSQILLCGCFDEYKGVVDEYKGMVTPLKSSILSFFYSL